MKTMRLLLVLIASMMLVIRVSAQTINTVLVAHSRNMVQTSASSVTDASATAYFFQASIEGSGFDGDPVTASVALPGGSPVHNLLIDTNKTDGRVLYRSGNYSTLADLKAAFGAGSYHIAASSTSIGSGGADITLGDPTAISLNDPLLTLTSAGGSWTTNPGTFTFTVGQDIVIDFATIGAAGQYHYDFSANGPGTLHDPEHEPNGLVDAGDAPPQFTVSTAGFTPGQSYFFEVGYDYIYDFGSDQFGLGETDAGIYEIRSIITLTAVPEPPTYAAILGVVALAGVAIRRRRLQAA